MSQTISGEEYSKIVSTKRPKNNAKTKKYLIVAAAVVVIAGLSFYGGDQYGKQHHATALTSSNAFGGSGAGAGAGGGRFARADRVVGTVSAISPTSISVDSRSGTTVTLNITSSTQITDSGQTVSASNIQTGDIVFISEDPSSTSNAQTILVNPSFGGFGGGSSGGGSSSPTTSPTSSSD